jgi:hypothetical protein
MRNSTESCPVDAIVETPNAEYAVCTTSTTFCVFIKLIIRLQTETREVHNTLTELVATSNFTNRNFYITKRNYLPMEINGSQRLALSLELVSVVCSAFNFTKLTVRQMHPIVKTKLENGFLAFIYRQVVVTVK